jgi:hypothetical protein
MAMTLAQICRTRGQTAGRSPELFDGPQGGGEFNVPLCYRPCQNSFLEARRHENWGNCQTRMASGSRPSRTGSSNVWRGRASGHTIARALLGVGDLAGVKVHWGSSENSVGARAVAAQWRSRRASARRLQGCGPPQQIVDQRPGRRLQLGQSSFDIAASVVSPQGGDRDVDR